MLVSSPLERPFLKYKVAGYMGKWEISNSCFAFFNCQFISVSCALSVDSTVKILFLTNSHITLALAHIL